MKTVLLALSIIFSSGAHAQSEAGHEDFSYHASNRTWAESLFLQRILRPNVTAPKAKLDELGRVIEQPARGGTIYYTYEGNKKKSAALPNGLLKSYFYNQDGKLALAKFSNGRTVNYEHYGVGRRLTRVYDTRGTQIDINPGDGKNWTVTVSRNGVTTDITKGLRKLLKSERNFKSSKPVRHVNFILTSEEFDDSGNDTYSDVIDGLLDEDFWDSFYDDPGYSEDNGYDLSCEVNTGGGCPRPPSLQECYDDCYRWYLQDIETCQDRYPSGGTSSDRQRAICYSRSTSLHADCRVDCSRGG